MAAARAIDWRSTLPVSFIVLRSDCPFDGRLLLTLPFELRLLLLCDGHGQHEVTELPTIQDLIGLLVAQLEPMVSNPRPARSRRLRRRLHGVPPGRVTTACAKCR